MTEFRRATFTTSRALEFFTPKGLTTQTGHGMAEWALVILKELADNALDICEEAGIAPEIRVTVDSDGITVADNGPGLPASTLAGVLDYKVRVSSREAYAAPDRGAQGNALKTIMAMPCVSSMARRGASPSAPRASAMRSPSASIRSSRNLSSATTRSPPM
jgi:DNA topoisomerase VI subunit B